jgi:hypothetical protein
MRSGASEGLYGIFSWGLGRFALAKRQSTPLAALGQTPSRCSKEKFEAEGAFLDTTRRSRGRAEQLPVVAWLAHARTKAVLVAAGVKGQGPLACLG